MRKDALPSLPRGLEADPFDQPLAVVAVAEVTQPELELFEVLEGPHSEKLLLEGAEE